jgi:hypothetical protein
MTNFETALNRLDDRLLKTEGQLFALKAVVHTAISVDNVTSAILRKALIGMADSLASELPNAPDEPTRKFVVAAQGVINELLSEPMSPPKTSLHHYRGREVRDLAVRTHDAVALCRKAIDQQGADRARRTEPRRDGRFTPSANLAGGKCHPCSGRIYSSSFAPFAALFARAHDEFAKFGRAKCSPRQNPAKKTKQN